MRTHLKFAILGLLMLAVLTLSGCNTAHYDMGVGQSVLTIIDVEVDEDELVVYTDNNRSQRDSLDDLIDGYDSSRTVEVQLQETVIEWRYTDEVAWETLVEREEYEAESEGFGWVQTIVGWVAELVYQASRLGGGNYFVGLIAITLLIRIAGWPIYSKSNAVSINMQMAQPAIEKLKEKYQGKTDQKSQQAMQREQMQIMKEYGVNPLGCLLPFLQMPIFIAMYQTVRRIPYTDRFVSGDDALNFNFLFFDFSAEPVSPFYSPENWTFLLMAGIVGLTMFFYQRYAMRKPEQLQNKKYKTAQQQQSENTMKYMMYFMTFMLVFIAFTSLGIAFYWVIGNLFQFVQTYITRKKLIQKLEAKKDLV